MKKTFIKFLSLALIAVLMTCLLAGCGKQVPKGSYSAELEVVGQSWKVTYTFKGGKVEAENKITLLGKVSNETSKGTYEIKENADGTMEITFDFEEETSAFKDGTVTYEEGEDFIKLGGVKYTKS